MALRDAKGRTITYLRVSLTDRCNYRCTYCMPPEGFDRAPREDLLTLEEVARLVRVFAGLGVTSVRLTGGEPTIRRGLEGLVADLAGTPGIRDVALTTNGERLTELAAPLRAAGLSRLNVSLDTLRPERHLRLTRGGVLAHVLEGLEAARAAGFSRIKLNAVAVRGENDDEIEALVRWAWERDLVPRFIELMPIGEAGRMHGRDAVVSISEIRRRLSPLIADVPADTRMGGSGPAAYYPAREGAGRAVGFIGAVTEAFCAGCNRVRLTSEGQLRGCLARPEGSDLRALLRGGAEDAELAEAISATVLGRQEGHAFWDAEGADPSDLVVMTRVGG